MENSKSVFVLRSIEKELTSMAPAIATAAQARAGSGLSSTSFWS